MSKAWKDRSGCRQVGHATSPDGRMLEVWTLGVRLIVVDTDAGKSVGGHRPGYRDWDELRADWPGASAYGTD